MRNFLNPVVWAWMVSGLLVFQVTKALAQETPIKAQEDASQNSPPFDLTDPTRIQDGKKRFNGNCAAYCHGSEGMGGKSTPFKNYPGFDQNYAFRTIADGRRGTGVMPPWGKSLTPEQIWELVAYLKFLSIQTP